MDLPRLGVWAALVCSLPACELTEVTIVDLAEIFIVEALVTVGEDPGDNSLRVFVHGTSPGGGPSSGTFDDARVTVTQGDASSAPLGLVTVDDCATVLPEDALGSCFAAETSLAATYRAGEALALDVELPDGRRVSGSTTIPGAFQVSDFVQTCVLQPNTRLSIEWSRSPGARAYVGEALIVGLGDALDTEGIDAPDSLYIVGLSISESDTTISFPDQFGVFDRFDLDRELSIRLQRGIPEGVRADIAITALDANQTNWARGGNFNPSGAVRVPSVSGDGSGAFGSAVTRRFTVLGSTEAGGEASCDEPNGSIPGASG